MVCGEGVCNEAEAFHSWRCSSQLISCPLSEPGRGFCPGDGSHFRLYKQGGKLQFYTQQMWETGTRLLMKQLMPQTETKELLFMRHMHINYYCMFFSHRFNVSVLWRLQTCDLYANFQVTLKICRFSHTSPSACHRLPRTYIFSKKRGNRPVPSLATSSSSAEVLAEAMASGSFRVKGNTSLRDGEREIEWKGKTLCQQQREEREKEGGTINLIPKVWVTVPGKEQCGFAELAEVERN